MKCLRQTAALIGILLCGVFSYASPLASTEKMENAVRHATRRTTPSLLYGELTYTNFGKLHFEAHYGSSWNSGVIIITLNYNVGRCCHQSDANLNITIECALSSSSPDWEYIGEATPVMNGVLHGWEITNVEIT